MPGTFYQAPAPGEKPFVQVGDTVSAGQVVCILDVMKVMNQLTASAPGRVVRVDVRDADSVAAGQPMIWIEPA
jgi:biotin carboxyl carrier protein